MRQKVTAPRLEEFMKALASGVTEAARVYLVGGASSVLMGWRESTIDIDLKLAPEHDEILRRLAALKERLQLNIELASPDDFIPALPGWQERSSYIRQEGKLTFLHYDFYGQALAKIERDHGMDLSDVSDMIKGKLVEPGRMLVLFSQIEDQLHRYPALDPATFRRAVESVVKSSQNG